MRQKGLFITFEGGDGSGKSTLLERLYETLRERGHSLIKTREPGGTPLGDKIRRLLLDIGPTPVSAKSELLLYLASRAQHVQEVIEPALAEGKIVLCDRFNDSTFAYQGAARRIDSEMVRNLCHFVSNGLVPDLTLFLDIEPAEGIRRVALQKRPESQGEKDRIEDEALEFHERVREAYLQALAREPSRIKRIDAARSRDEVFDKGLHHILALLCPCSKHS